MSCPQYSDGEHCFVPGVLRTVSPGSEPAFLRDWSSCCTDDALLEPAKACECGAVVKSGASIRPYDVRSQAAGERVTFGVVQR